MTARTYTVHLYQLDHLGARFRHEPPGELFVDSGFEARLIGVDQIARAGIDLPVRDWVDLGRPGTLELAITTTSTPRPYKVGDPDPTPDVPDGTPCEHASRASSRLKCTWDRGHHGDHIAGNGQIILAIWPNDDHPALADEARS